MHPLIDYFDHDADIGIIGRGKSLEENFENAAKAMFSFMGDLMSVKPMYLKNIEFFESDIEFAFVTWLNQLIAIAQAENMIFCRFCIKKIMKNGMDLLKAKCGEKRLNAVLM